MDQYLIDTNFIVDVLRGFRKSAEFIDSLENKYISVVTWYELVEGVENQKEQSILVKYLSQFEVINITEDISKHSLRLMLKFNLSNNLQHDDALIASTCVENNLTLATRNIKHFNFIENLKLVQLAM